MKITAALLPLILLLTPLISWGQFQSPQIPKPSTPSSPVQVLSPKYQTQNPKPASPNPTAVHQNNMRRQRQRAQIMQEMRQDIADMSKAIQYELPSQSHLSATKYYQTAFAELQKMGDTAFSIKQANFIVENAFFENQGNYEEFEKVVQQTGNFLRQKIQDFGYNPESNLAKNLTLLRFFSDTLRIESQNLEHLPFQYEFDDFMGRNDWTNMFVTKLLETNKGQCHSLPMLYLILAEEIEAEARLAFSPNHSYIKFPDDKGKWVNVELTNGMLTTDAFILQSGYIKAEALQNKVYMQPLTDSQLRAQILVDLAKGYSRKFGYDSFVEQVIDQAIQLDPNNIFAQMVKADYLTIRFMYVAKQLGLNRENFQKVKQYPKATALYQEQMKQYEVVDNLGYEPMPQEMYQEWLESLNEAKQKQQSDNMRIRLESKQNPAR